MARTARIASTSNNLRPMRLHPLSCNEATIVLTVQPTGSCVGSGTPVIAVPFDHLIRPAGATKGSWSGRGLPRPPHGPVLGRPLSPSLEPEVLELDALRAQLGMRWSIIGQSCHELAGVCPLEARCAGAVLTQSIRALQERVVV